MLCHSIRSTLIATIITARLIVASVWSGVYISHHAISYYVSYSMTRMQYCNTHNIVFVYVCVCVCVCVVVRVCVRVCACTCVSIYIYIYIYIYIHIYTCISVYVHVQVYAYVFVYVHMPTCMYMHNTHNMFQMCAYRCILHITIIFVFQHKFLHLVDIYCVFETRPASDWLQTFTINDSSAWVHVTSIASAPDIVITYPRDRGLGSKLLARNLPTTPEPLVWPRASSRLRHDMGGWYKHDLLRSTSNVCMYIYIYIYIHMYI